ncbi:hypothetical protein MHBO_003924, partial [Bonamia ostreae]
CSIGAVFAPFYSKSIIYVLYGKRWLSSGADVLLIFYVICIILEALKGISDALLNTLTKNEDVLGFFVTETISDLIGIFTFVVFATTYEFAYKSPFRQNPKFAKKIGVMTLVTGKFIGICMRLMASIAYSAWYSKQKKGDFGKTDQIDLFKKSLPPKDSMFMFFVVFVILLLSHHKFDIGNIEERYLRRVFSHSVVGLACLFFCALKFYSDFNKFL